MTLLLYLCLLTICSLCEFRTGVSHMSPSGLRRPLTSSLPCQPQTLNAAVKRDDSHIYLPQLHHSAYLIVLVYDAEITRLCESAPSSRPSTVRRHQ